MILPSTRDEGAKRLLEQLYTDLRSGIPSGRIGDAAQYLSDDVAPGWRASIANILAHHYFQKGKFSEALIYCRTWLASDPSDLRAVTSLLSILTRLKRWDEVIALATEQLTQHHDEFRLHSAVCQALARVGRLDEARTHGTRCLALKDQSTTADPFDLTNVSVPALSSHRVRNVIAFSLFGRDEKYFKGAVTNVHAARFIYPQWTCRFYIDEAVPKSMVQQLSAEGAELKTVQGLPSQKYGTFWRFLVADDREIDRYLIRDCDSVVNVRERLAVDEWIESRRHFHVMRDFYTHTELVLAGMWGGVAGALPPMGKTFCAYVEQSIYHRTLDQEYLRTKLWPTIRQSVLVHDSHFDFGEHRDFPRLGQLPKGAHVGISQF